MRAGHLRDLERGSTSDRQSSASTDFNQFFAMKLDRTILDYLLREGYFITARLFAKQKGITEFSDLPVFESIR